jgi:L-lactate dehydrogenase (cytochrome)
LYENRFVDEDPDELKSHRAPRNRDQGVARAISQFIDPSLNWEDLAWFRSATKMPILLKGVQCGEDAVLALEYGMNGVVLSNHGGR